MERLNILWTTDNKDTAKNMILMYAIFASSNNLWEEVQIILWGASPKLVSSDEDIQKLISVAKEAGVKFSACRSCTDNLEVTAEIEALDIHTKYWGEGFTEILKSDDKLITI